MPHNFQPSNYGVMLLLHNAVLRKTENGFFISHIEVNKKWHTWLLKELTYMFQTSDDNCEFREAFTIVDGCVLLYHYPIEITDTPTPLAIKVKNEVRT